MTKKSTKKRLFQVEQRLTTVESRQQSIDLQLRAEQKFQLASKYVLSMIVLLESLRTPGLSKKKKDKIFHKLDRLTA